MNDVKEKSPSLERVDIERAAISSQLAGQSQPTNQHANRQTGE